VDACTISRRVQVPQGRRPSVPVILITAKVDVARAVQALRSGPYDFLTKPFDMHELNAIVLRAIGDGGRKAEE